MISLALVGYGQVVERFHAPALAAAPGLRLGCVVEPDAARRAAARARFPGVPGYASLDEALAAGTAEAALVATPPATHAELAQGCLAAGWPALVEKPLAGTLPDAFHTLAAAKRAGRPLAIGFNRRFRASWRAARRRLAGAGLDNSAGASCTLVFDTRRWRSAATLDSEDAAVARLVEDVVPHQADLVPYLLHRPILRARATDVRLRQGRSAELAYELELPGGAVVRCRAAHAPWHEETFEVGVAGRRLLVTPGAVVEGQPLPAWRRRAAALRGALADRVRRVARRPSATAASFAAQLRAFAAAARGEPAGDLADGAAGVSACAVADALRASVRGGGGAWLEVEGARG